MMSKKNILTLTLALAFVSVIAIAAISCASDDSSATVQSFDAPNGSRITLSFDETNNATLVSVLSDDPEHSVPKHYEIPENIVMSAERTLTITAIGPKAFDGCDITTISIPATVSSIQGGAFTGCSKLVYFEVAEGSNYYKAGTNREMLFTRDMTCLVAYPSSASLNYRNVTVPAGVTTILAGAFESTNVVTISFIGSSVNAIPQNAFANCASLTSVTFCGSIASIGQCAFEGCTLLSSLDLSDATSLRIIGEAAFSSCTNLSSVSDLPASLESIGNRAFMGCSQLRTFSNADGLVSIGTSAFKNCTHLQTFKLPASFRTLNDSAFENCASLTNVNTSESSLELIAMRAFGNCISLTSMVIPATVNSIAPSAFNGCIGMKTFSVSSDNAKYRSENGVIYDKSLTKLVAYPVAKNLDDYTVPTGVSVICEHALRGATNIRTVTIPASVRTIEAGAFSECSELRAVTFAGDGLDTIGPSAFGGCTKLTSFQFPSTVRSIGSSAFMNCTNLRSIEIRSPASIAASAFTQNTNAVSVYVAEGSSFTQSSFVGFRFYDGGTETGLTAGHYYAGNSMADLHKDMCAVIYYLDGTEYTSPAAYSAGSTVTLLAKPVKEGYRVSDWYCDGTDISSGTFTLGRTAVITAVSERIVSPSDIREENGKTVIEIPDDSAVIEKSAVDTMKDSVITLGKVSIAMSSDALNRISAGQEFSVSAKTMTGIQNPAALAKLTDEEKIAAADALVIDFDFGCAGSLNGLGTVTVTVPYDKGEMPVSKIAVYYIAEDGTFTKMDASYADGYVTFETDHFSIYSVGKSFDSQEPYHPGDDDNTNMLIFVGTAAVLIAVAAGGIIAWKRKKQ